MRCLRALLLPFVVTVTAVTNVAVVHAQELSKQSKTTDASYVVVLKNGKKVPARTKPVIAFGKANIRTHNLWVGFWRVRKLGCLRCRGVL